MNHKCLIGPYRILFSAWRLRLTGNGCLAARKIGVFNFGILVPVIRNSCFRAIKTQVYFDLSDSRFIKVTSFGAVQKLIANGSGDLVISVAPSPAGELFATGSGDMRARIWRSVDDLRPFMRNSILISMWAL